MSFVIIETKRLILRKMRASDDQALFQIFNDPKAMKFYPHIKSVDETKLWIQSVQDHDMSYGFSLWTVEKKGEKQILGQCGLLLQKVDGVIEVELGYLFLQDFWGKGYATEAAQGCINYGFHKLGLTRITALIDPKHHASQKVVVKIGMKKEKQIIKWNKPIDVYSIQTGGMSVD
ncbi:GNAT family N-acetyltransferase [Priestia flexa]|uniref:GNAT family N-acetyltransferase n=1 Tax=Priestia flexa TaxID=86664 RepID=UPI001B320246|nr:GNAT family N-acetyltransferase [Priestia flexa]